jgi:hypothetical protein
MSAAPKRKSPGQSRGSDSWQNLATNIPHPLAFSSENEARAEVFRLALAALSTEELFEWFSLRLTSSHFQSKGVGQ